ncbi:MAG: hypothetical protein LBL49_06610 [Clostridiales Family XIII bacterium]|nr:hypothetical protein [Clostridiales Family XIII bacterium]
MDTMVLNFEATKSAVVLGVTNYLRSIQYGSATMQSDMRLPIIFTVSWHRSLREDFKNRVQKGDTVEAKVTDFCLVDIGDCIVDIDIDSFDAFNIYY